MKITNKTFLLALAGFSLLTLPIVFWTTGFFRIVFSLPTIFFIPGWVLLAALFPGRRVMTTGTRIALSAGFSLAIVPLVGLFMHFMPWGLTMASVLAGTVVFITLVAAAAWNRDSRLPAAEELSYRLPALPALRELGRAEKRLTFALLGVLVILAGVTAWAVATPSGGELYTEFYILDSAGTTIEYPARVAYGEPVSVRAAVTSHESDPASYTVEVSVDGVPVHSLETGSLAPGASWQDEVSYIASSRGDRQKVEYRLFKDGAALPYFSDPLFFVIDVY